MEWAPDGKGLQFSMIRNGAENIWELPLAGGEPRQITNFTADRIFDFVDGRWQDVADVAGDGNRDVILLSNFR